MSAKATKWSLEYLACFITGFVILLLELIAFRLLAPYFGVSSYVTGIVINAILLALAAGYLLGGYIADKNRSTKLPYIAILASTFYLLVVYVFYSPLLQILSKHSLSVGVSLTVLLMFFVPVVLLAFIPPYFVKLIAQNEALGKTTGQIYALSTIGSIVGGLVTTFVFIPFLGSRTTFFVAILLLLIVSMLGLKRNIRSALFLSLLSLPLFFVPNLPQGDYVYKGESEYNFITITSQEGALFLRLNDGLGQHSKTLDPDTMLSNYYYDDFLFAQMLTEAEYTLILGNGAGTSMLQASHFFSTRIDGVELDPRLTTLGQTHFGLQRSAKTSIFHEDARAFLNKSTREYDVIYVDVYAGGPYVPFHVATLEFYERIKSSLTQGGILAVNIPFFSVGTDLGEYFLNTISSVFPGSTYRSGCMVYAFNGEMSQTEMEHRLAGRRIPPILQELAQRIVSGLHRVEAGREGPIFTDDLAPVESMTSRLLKIGLDSYSSCDNSAEIL